MNLKDVCKNKSGIEMFYHWEKERPTDVYLSQPIEDVWYEYTWTDVSYHVRRLTAALFAMGFKKGDKIALLSKNCAEWLITDLALQLGGFVSVPLYFDLTPDTLKYVLEHSESKALFVGKLDESVWDRLKGEVPEEITQIAFSFHGADADFHKDDFEHHLMDLVEAHEPYTESPVHDDEDIWTIVYTSGTTGYPKGAVHCYRAPRFVGQYAVETFGLTEGKERGLSFLPLAHVAERLLVASASMYCNGQISFVQSLNTFQRDLTMVQPTIFFSVPRLWKKFQGGILEKLPQEKLDLLLRIPVLRKLLAKKLRGKLGLAKARMVVSGAAPISPALLEWYGKLGIEILEGYGMTENFAYGCIGRIGHNKMGTVGLPMENSGFKLSEQGEILFKSPTLMKEYYKEPEKTAEVIDADGYYHSGDLGEVDADGFVRISGRVKEIFKTEKGEYVAPAPIEGKVAAFKDFEQICLGGSGLAQPVLVVTLTEQAQGKSQAELTSAMGAHIKDLNTQLLNHEKIAGVVVADGDWLPETGLVTPTLKIKRNKIEEKYAERMAEVVKSGTLVIWEKAA